MSTQSVILIFLIAVIVVARLNLDQKVSINVDCHWRVQLLSHNRDRDPVMLHFREKGINGCIFNLTKALEENSILRREPFTYYLLGWHFD